MASELPTPPAEIPTDIVDTLNGYAPEQLRRVTQYAEELAKHKTREQRLKEKAEEDEVQDYPDNLPDGVPTKATITIKEINDNRYYYWQWRDGDQTKSKYKAPVNPDE